MSDLEFFRRAFQELVCSEVEHVRPAELVDAIGATEALKNTLDALQARYEVALREARIAAHRAAVDAELAPALHELSPVAAGRRARACADALDQEAAVARVKRNVAQRHVSQRPAADGMMRLSALLPLHEGIAAFASLGAAANSARARGDGRSRGQVMADALISRITGQEGAIAPVEIHLLMTDHTLMGGGTDTAELEGHPIPGPVARHLALTGDLFPADPEAEKAVPGITQPVTAPGEPRHRTTQQPPLKVKRWIRRLYADPHSGALTSIDARRRLFTGHVRRFVLARDRRCRTPGCEAVPRHVHHVDGFAGGGTTTPENGAALCERFNYVAEIPGWGTDVDRRTGTLIITTPTGHQYRSPIPSQFDGILQAAGTGKGAGILQLE